METSVKGGSISIFTNGKLVDFHIGDKAVSGSEDLLPKISELLKKNDLSRSEIDTIAVSNGPGSFTGIRIGIATALALQKSLNCKCYGVDLLQAMASDGKLKTKTENIITAVSHGRNKICWFDFKSKQNLEKNYFLSDVQFLFEYIAGEIEKKTQFAVYTDTDVFREIIEKQNKKLLAKFNILNAGENLSLVLGNTVLSNSLILEKPKPLYLNESNIIISEK